MIEAGDTVDVDDMLSMFHECTGTVIEVGIGESEGLYHVLFSDNSDGWFESKNLITV